jgi:hypothetical protein
MPNPIRQFPPEGYDAWSCDLCTAACNFEVMHYCGRRTDPTAECGFENDQPDSFDGHLEFMVKSGSLAHKGPPTRTKP